MTTARRRVLIALTALSGLTAALLSSVLLIQPPGPGPVGSVRNADLHELPGSDEEPWSVVVIRDVQNGHAYLPELLRRAGACSPRAIVITGDLAPDPNPELSRIPVWWLRRLPAPAPMFIVPGNHDLCACTGRRIGEREFLQWYGSLTFDFRIGRTRFIGLDNSTSPIVGADLDSLRSKLEGAKARGERTLLWLHRNVVSFGDPTLSLEANPELQEMIRDYDVPYVICGHLHRDAFEESEGTRYAAMPASGHRPANDADQKPIAFMELRWDGRSFELRREEFYRRNLTELKGVFVYLALAKIQPMFHRRPIFASALVGACIFVAVAGAGLLWRRRKGDAC